MGKKRATVGAVAARKGGAAKSTTTSMLACESAKLGKSVAVIDMDDQAAQTDYWLSAEVRSDEVSPETSSRRLLTAPELGTDGLFWDITLDLERYAQLADQPAVQLQLLQQAGLQRGWRDGGSLKILPGHESLDTARDSINAVLRRKYPDPEERRQIRAEPDRDPELRLRTAIADICDTVDIVLFDTAPADALPLHSVLMAADWVLIPSFMDAANLAAVQRTLRIITEVNQKRAQWQIAPLQVLGVVACNMNDTVKFHQTMYRRFAEALELEQRMFGLNMPMLFSTIIPMDLHVQIATSYGMPVQLLDPRSPAGEACRPLATEVMQRANIA